MKTSWEEEFEKIMPKTSGETISYGQFTAVRNLIEKVRQKAIMETEAECQKSIKQMNDSWNDVLRDKIMEVIEAIPDEIYEPLDVGSGVMHGTSGLKDQLKSKLL